jgi:carbon monoxide dehydrogenase subunit G
MKLEHEFRVPVPITQAWDVLLDVERIAPCMPGATVESFDGETVHGRVKVKVGPIQVTYGGTARFIEKNEAGRRVTLDASGKEARGSGTAKATIVAVLQDEGSLTLVTVTTDLAITGKPAQFGRGVMVEVGNKLLGRFADCLAAEIGGSSGDAGAEVADSGPAVHAVAAAAEEAVGAAVAGNGAASPATGDGAVAGEGSAAASGGNGASGASRGAAGAPGPTNNGGTTAAAQVRPLASASTYRAPARVADNEPIDLLDVGGAAILRRLAPLAVGLVALFVLWRLRRRR